LTPDWEFEFTLVLMKTPSRLMHFLEHFLVDFSVNKEGEDGHINQPQQKKRFFLET
jgi:hypothetical protein